MLVDVDLARLEQVRAAIDPEIVNADRREAAERVTLPTSPEAILLKKYHTAAISTFLRALRDFHKLEKSEPEVPQTQTQDELVASERIPAAVDPVAPSSGGAASAPITNEPKLAVATPADRQENSTTPDRSAGIPGQQISNH